MMCHDSHSLADDRSTKANTVEITPRDVLLRNIHFLRPALSQWESLRFPSADAPATTHMVETQSERP